MLVIVIALLTGGPARAAQTAGTDPQPPALPVSLDRVRAALERSPRQTLKIAAPTPDFRVEIKEDQRFRELLPPWLDFRSGPIPPGGLYAFEQKARLSSPWGGVPIVSVDLLAIGHSIANGISRARRAHAEAAAREEVQRALDDFWLAQGKTPATTPR